MKKKFFKLLKNYIKIGGYRMNIQSLSICVPAQRCINDCKFCCSKMHGGDYEDLYTNPMTYESYVANMKKRMQYARDNGCNTIMLTGNNEPQQNKEFLKTFAFVNKSLTNPFINIEMQTSGAFIDRELLLFLRDTVGVTTVAISVACINDVNNNIEMIQCKDKSLSVFYLSNLVKELNMNLRLCLNMNDNMYSQNLTTNDKVEEIIKLVKLMKADQLTVRALWSNEPNTDQYKWIQKNVTADTMYCIECFKQKVKHEGRYLDTLEYGADRYDFRDLSVVIDEDSMSQDINKQSVKYLILRPNGKLYSKWDSKASLIF